MKCPYCSAPMEKENYEFSMSRKRLAIYKSILNSGVDGISSDDLVAKYYAKGSPVSLRTAIHYINKAISPLAIERKNGKYRITAAAENT